jgi:hypothetical protein
MYGDFFVSPRDGAKLCTKNIQGKSNVLCRFAVVISAARVVPGIAEEAALLGCIQGDFCCSSAVRVIVDQVAETVE